MVSIASFVNDELDECVDMTIRSTKAVDPHEIAKKMKTKPLTASCAATFPGRIILATCTASKTAEERADAGTPGSVSLVSRYYRLGTVVDSDAFMKQCLMDAGGKWDALPRESEQFKEAERQWRERNIRRAVEAAK